MSAKDSDFAWRVRGVQSSAAWAIKEKRGWHLLLLVFKLPLGAWRALLKMSRDRDSGDVNDVAWTCLTIYRTFAATPRDNHPRQRRFISGTFLLPAWTGGLKLQRGLGKWSRAGTFPA